MKERPYWLGRIKDAWRKRPIVWLAGVRRTGKTTLSKMLPDARYFNCDLPSVAQRMEDPEQVFGALPGDTVYVFDEIHRLPDPSRVLKIAADAYPGLRILATGSSTLAATRKFRDTLTGRKTVLRLAPVLWPECVSGFDVRDLDFRLIRGGLPEMLLAESREDEAYAEWLESFFARDIQELFGIRERTGFLSLLRLLLRQSGGLVDYSRLSRECGLARPTTKSHIEALSVACGIQQVRPFHGGGRREIVAQPKCYGFDTGFVAFARGWRDIRDEDRGLLWEHLVLDVLVASAAGSPVSFWRDKSGREVDFVIPRGRDVDAYECKVNPAKFDPEAMRVFREAYPRGKNFLVAPAVAEPFERSYGNIRVHVTGCSELLGGG